MNNILEYLKKQAERVPEKIAFADEQTSISFKELYDRGRIVGTSLAAYDCVRKPVPLLMEKNVLTVELMMGVVFAGGFYVILDPAQPEKRLSQILNTLEADILVTTSEYQECANSLEFSGKKIDASELIKGQEDEGILKIIEKQHLDTDPLYVLFTSGSTGIPKGVVVGHRSVIDFIDEFTRIFDITEADVLGNQAPLDFDVSVKDLYSGLATGATVELIPKDYFSVPVKLMDFLEEKGVTNLTWAVSALSIVSILDGLSYKTPKAIKRIMFSGEAMPVKHYNYWRSYYPEVRFVNLYGPTEITCNCTYYEVDREFEAGDKIPIGKSFPNEKVFLLDENDREVLEYGKEGEICVAGSCLALGYYNDPIQTAKAFVPNPLNIKWMETIYRTGDMAFYDEDGNLCFASRKDFQIKHMGHRIELGEIENALEKIDEIKRSCVVFDEAKNKIVCFYQGDIAKREIVKEAKKYLQDFMIPNVFRQMEALPVTANGKLDRKALKESLMKKGE